MRYWISSSPSFLFTAGVVDPWWEPVINVLSFLFMCDSNLETAHSYFLAGWPLGPRFPLCFFWAARSRSRSTAACPGHQARCLAHRKSSIKMCSPCTPHPVGLTLYSSCGVPRVPRVPIKLSLSRFYGDTGEQPPTVHAFTRQWKRGKGVGGRWADVSVWQYYICMLLLSSCIDLCSCILQLQCWENEVSLLVCFTFFTLILKLKDYWS